MQASLSGAWSGRVPWEIHRMELIKGLRDSAYLLFNLVSKDFKLKYRRSVLGVLWSVLNPLLTMIVLSAVFSQLFRFSIEHYPVYFILGQTLFTMMTDGVGEAMRSIIDSAPLIKKIKVNKFVFPVEKVLFAIVNYAFSLIAIFLVMIFFQIEPTPWLLMIPVVVALVALFSLGLSLLLSALATFFHDFLHLWGVLVTLWTYMTPLFYPVDILPEWMMSIMWFNPMYHYVTMMRNVGMYGVFPGWDELATCVIMAVVMFAVGYLVFKKLQRKFILYI